jgi:GNAT acetyltransferase
MPHTALELIALQYAALYDLDPHGRMLLVNDGPDSPVAPRFFMARTLEGHFVRFRADLTEDLVRTLTDLSASEPITGDFESPPNYAVAIRSIVGTPLEEYRGPAFLVPSRLPEHPGADILMPEQIAVLQEHYPGLIHAYEGCGPIAAVIVDGVAVSVCFSSRSRPASAEAGVDTIEAYRQRGYGRMAVVAWAQAVQAQGRVAFYGTTWDNRASRRLAESLGLQLIGENWSIG